MSVTLSLSDAGAALAPGEWLDGVTIEGRVAFRNRMGRQMIVRLTDDDGDARVFLRVHRDDYSGAFDVMCGLDLDQRVRVTGRLSRSDNGEVWLAVAAAPEVL